MNEMEIDIIFIVLFVVDDDDDDNDRSVTEILCKHVNSVENSGGLVSNVSSVLEVCGHREVKRITHPVSQIRW